MAQGREHLDHLFEIGLVLLGILSAAELQYFLVVLSSGTWFYVLRVFTIPLLALIVLWMFKECLFFILGNVIRVRYYINLVLTDFCWSLWGAVLFDYLSLMVGEVSIGIISSLALYFILLLLVNAAYNRASMLEQDVRILGYYRIYYGSLKGMAIRGLIFIVAYLLVLVMVYQGLVTATTTIISTGTIAP